MRGREKSSSPTYARLRSSNEAEIKGSVQKGYVPFLVGTSDEGMERVSIPIKFINHPSLVYLLDESAKEFGHCHQGLLRISCDVEKFKEIVDCISTGQ